jgi:hypothetical protein
LPFFRSLRPRRGYQHSKFWKVVEQKLFLISIHILFYYRRCAILRISISLHSIIHTRKAKGGPWSFGPEKPGLDQKSQVLYTSHSSLNFFWTMVISKRKKKTWYISSTALWPTDYFQHILHKLNVKKTFGLPGIRTRS